MVKLKIIESDDDVNDHRKVKIELTNKKMQNSNEQIEERERVEKKKRERGERRKVVGLDRKALVIHISA